MDATKDDEKLPPPSQCSNRIFIGGIDPLYGLTPQMVLDRLPPSVQQVHLGNRGVHCTVVDAAQRAAIQRMFHNVKWKHCKLTVEDAKCNFLQRLEQERMEPTPKSTTDQEPSQKTVEEPTQKTMEEEPSVQHHRHWRVKRRFGAPTVLVDTHPKIVSSWSDFRLNRAKKYNQSRSIHLKFGTYETSKKKESSDEDSSMSDGHSIASGDSSVVEIEGPSIVENEGVGTYAWSSDDDSSDESSQVVEVMAPLKGTPHAADSHSIRENEGGGAYAWSSDDSSDESSVVEVVAPTTLEGTPHAMASSEEDESVANGSREASEDSNESMPPTHEANPENVDLSKDMEMNDSILAQLFPDSFKESSRKPQETTKKRNMTASMVRYDPTNQTAQSKYELSDEEGSEDQTLNAMETDDKPENHVESQVHEDTDQAIEEVTANPGQESYVYEQSKLESVFKESREQVPQSQSQPGAFSFGFALASPLAESAADADIVDPPIALNEDSNVKSPAEDPAIAAMEISAPIDSIEKTDSNEFEDGPTLFDFPSDELLDSLTQKYFLGFEDGRRIAEDLEGWRKDPKVRESWLERRATLTLDWKRKRKAAIANRKKREDKHRAGRPR